MKTGWKFLIVSLALISLGALGGLFYLSKTELNKARDFGGKYGNGEVAGASTAIGDDYLESLAKTLRDKGAVIYCSFQSSDCKNQKDLFGNSANLLNYVECDAAGSYANPDECISQKIDSYPTWIYQGNRLIGKQSLANLAKFVDFSQ